MIIKTLGALILLFSLVFNTFSQKQKIWLDTDMGNEIDDIFALTRLLVEADKYDMVGVSSAHFNNADLVVFDHWNQYPTKGITNNKIWNKDEFIVRIDLKTMN